MDSSDLSTGEPVSCAQTRCRRYSVLPGNVFSGSALGVTIAT